MATFEVGKTYRTRGGETARVTRSAVAEGSMYPIFAKHGAGLETHTSGGLTYVGSEHEFDLLPGAIEDDAKPDTVNQTPVDANLDLATASRVGEKVRLRLTMGGEARVLLLKPSVAASLISEVARALTLDD